MADGETLNIPQLLAFMLISAIAIRYFFFTPSTARNSAAAQSSTSSVQTAPGRRVDERHVTTLQAMFPQLDRRAILWDLMRNGGSVQATSERVLAGPGLDTPPQSFQPPPPPASEASQAGQTPRQQQQQQQQQKTKRPDLITRYGLGEKVREEQGAASVAEVAQSRQQTAMWSANKSERQALLQRRKEQMILDARRKLEMKERDSAGAGAA